MSQAFADRNLLLGILALQMDFINRESLLAAMNTWVLNKTKPLSEILVQQGNLKRDHQELLEAMVSAHIREHDNKAELSLAALSSVASVRQDLERLADAEVAVSLNHVPHGIKSDDSFPTYVPETGNRSVPGSRFRILRMHARGGLGQVSVAIDEELHREVALKEMLTSHADNDESRRRFVLEAEITGRLEHPGIVPVYGLGQYADGRPFYAMRFVKGDSLKTAIEAFHTKYAATKQDPGRRLLELRDLLGRLIDVCNAVAYAHSRGVLHRDLKPGNIMLGKYGETLVVDWGLAKSLGEKGAIESKDESHLIPGSSSAGATLPGSAIGTPAYMSPEQAAGDLNRVGPASDVYSLGATLYAILTGSQSVESDDVWEILRCVQKGEIRPPSQIVEAVPRSLEAICLKAMALRPENRYPSPRDLANDLEHWLADEPVSVATETLSERMARWSRRHRSAVHASVIAVFVILAVLGVSLAVVNREKDLAKGLAKEKSDLADVNAELAGEKTQLAENEGIARKQAQIAQAEARSQREDYRHRLSVQLVKNAERSIGTGDLALALLWYVKALEVDSGDVTREPMHRLRIAMTRRLMPRLTGLLAHDNFISWAERSPDGKFLVTASYDDTARIWNVETGKLVAKPIKHGGYVYTACFSRDGKLVATACADGTARTWNAITGEPVSPPLEHGAPVHRVAFSPDGLRLATGCGRPQGIWAPPPGVDPDRNLKNNPKKPYCAVWTLSNPTEPVIPQSPQSYYGAFCLAWSPDGKTVAASGGAGYLYLFDSASGEDVLRLGLLSDHWGIGVSFDESGRYLLLQRSNYICDLWDLKGEKSSPMFSGYVDGQSKGGTPPSFKVNQDRTLAIGRDRFDLTTRNRTALLADAPTFGEFRCADRGYLLLNKTEGMSVWDLTHQHAVSSTIWHGVPPNPDVILTPDRRRLVFSDSEKRLMEVWDFAGQASEFAPQQIFGSAERFRNSTDGTKLIVGGSGGSAAILDTVTGKRVTPDLVHGAPDHEVKVTAVTFSPDGQTAVTAATDGRVRFWDAKTGSPQLPHIEIDGIPTDVCMTLDGKRVLVARRQRGHGGRTSITCWDYVNRKPEWKPFSSGNLNDEFLQLSCSGKLFACAGDNHIAFAVDSATGRAITPELKHSYLIGRPCFNADETILATPGMDSILKLWDLPEAKLVRAIQHPNPILCAAFSQDGKQIATADANRGCARIWCVETGLLVCPVLEIEANTVTSNVEFSRDNRTLLVGTQRHSASASLWDTSTGERVGPPITHTGQDRAAFTQDGTSFFTSGESLQRWNFAPETLSLEDLENIAAATSGREVNSTGTVVPLPSQKRYEAWERMQQSFPRDCVCSLHEVKSWRAREVQRLSIWNRTKAMPQEAASILDDMRNEEGEGIDLLIHAPVYAGAGQLDKAIDCLVERVLIGAAIPGEWQLLVNCMEKSKNAGRVIDAADHALQVDEKNWYAFCLKGGALLQLKRRDEAESALRKAVELGAVGPVFMFRALLFAEQERWADAEADFQRILAEEPMHVEGWTGLITVSLARYDHAEAKKQITRFIEKHRFSRASIQNAVARMEVMQQPCDSVLALSLANKAIAADPTTLQYLRTAGAAFYRAADYEEAVSQLTNPILAPIPPRAWDLLFLAMAQRQIGRNVEARVSYDLAMQWINEADQKNQWENWGEMVEVRLLRKEASELLGISETND